MKKSLLLLIASAFLTCSCSNNKKEQVNTDQLMFQLDSTVNQPGIQKMQVSTIDQLISLNGNKYSLYIHRAPGDSTTYVKCENGMFADNKIEVRISNPTNNNVIFSKVFTKGTFAEYLSEDFKKNGILEGIVYDSEKSEKSKAITLAASVSFPLSDLYIPFSIKISNGSISSITKDDNLDEVPSDGAN